MYEEDDDDLFDSEEEEEEEVEEEVEEEETPVPVEKEKEEATMDEAALYGPKKEEGGEGEKEEDLLAVQDGRTKYVPPFNHPPTHPFIYLLYPNSKQTNTDKAVASTTPPNPPPKFLNKRGIPGSPPPALMSRIFTLWCPKWPWISPLPSTTSKSKPSPGTPPTHLPI